MFKFLRRRKYSQGEQRLSDRKTAVCPQCSGAAGFLVASTDRNRHTTQDVFEYFQCSVCGLVFMDPIPEDLGPFYAGGYSPIPKTVEEFRIVAQPDRYRMDAVLPFKQSGKLLEIGPWMGVFCFNAREMGFDVTAMEMNAICVEFMNETLGIRAIQSADPAGTLAAMDEQFDVIALWHSLEHLRSPWLVIERAAERLAPGGLLLISLPNIDSLEFSILHAAWRNLDAPRHLYFFPPPSLDALCARLGLTKRFSTTNDKLSAWFSEDTWGFVANQLLPIRLARGVLKRLLKRAAQRRERVEDSGPGLTAVYERPASGELEPTQQERTILG